MEQQSTEDVKPKITRSRARHLRRKRLITARRAAENSSSISVTNETSRSIIEEKGVDSVQEIDDTDVLTKSKARRLRKKKKAEVSRSSNQTSENSISDSDNQKSLDSSDCQINALEFDGKFAQNFCDLQLNTVKSFDSLPSLHSVKGEGIFKYNFEVISNCKSLDDTVSLERNSNLAVASNDQDSKVVCDQDTIDIDTSKIVDACTKILSGIDFQIHETIESKVSLQSDHCQADVGSSTDVNYEGIEYNDPLFKTKFYEIQSETTATEADFLSNIKSFVQYRGETHDVPCFELTGDTVIAVGQPNAFNSDNENVSEALEKNNVNPDVNKSDSSLEPELKRVDKKGKRKKSQLKSPERKADEQEVEPETSKLHSSNIELEQDLFDVDINLTQFDTIKTYGFDDLFEPIVHAAEPVLNSTELIENQKNLKISGGPKPLSEILKQERISQIKVEPEPIVIDLTKDSSSDLIINNDSESRKIEEQRIIIDLISDSNSDLVRNIKVNSETTEGSLKTDLSNKSKKQRKSTAETLAKLSNPSAEVAHTSYIKSEPAEDVESSTLYEATTSWHVKSEIPEDTNSFFTDLSRICKPLKSKMSPEEKTREQIKAEREAKKAAKAAAKAKGKVPNPVVKADKPKGKETPSNTEIFGNLRVDVTPDAVEKVIESSNESYLRLTALDVKTVSSTDCNKENVAETRTEGKSKAELRAERRAKQEAQRAAKEKQLSEKKRPTNTEAPKAKAPPKLEDPVKKIVKKAIVDENPHEVKLFKHLYHARELSLVNVPTLNSNVHPAIVRLGVQYANKVIVGSNARCVALLAAVKQLVQDFERPSQADFTRGLEACLQECSAYLHYCRPLAVSMQNALKHLKWQMTQLPTTISDDEAKNKLGIAIDMYIKEQIQLADVQISNTIQTKISNGDVILTYGYSSLIHKILIDAHKGGRQFRVVIVDGRPWLEGKEQLRRLAKQGIECSYVLINALSFIMPEASKVFLGAHAILANGAVMSRVGTAQVALMAKAFNVPVLVACETHKSCERVQTDSFVYNEIGDADELTHNLLSKTKKSPLANWKTKKSLNLLNIMYDVTPADLVTAVVTELAILPCTSVPVILRIKPSEI